MIGSLVPASNASSRPRTVDMCEILNSIFYILVSGYGCRMLPHDFPPWSTVYYYFRYWRLPGLWQQMNQILRQKVRCLQGRQSTPSAAIVDS